MSVLKTGKKVACLICVSLRFVLKQYNVYYLLPFMGAKKFSLVRNMGGGGEELTQTTPLSLNNTDLSHSTVAQEASMLSVRSV